VGRGAALRVLSLFSGYGGFELALELVTGGRARCVCYVERETTAAAVLAARMGEGRLAAAPVWSDVRTFDARCWRGAVDCVVGGFPCTDVSNAGKRAGIDGAASGLWAEQLRIIRDTGCSVAIVENVAALAARGLDRVLGDLADLGFDAEWGVLRASDVGAPHRRARIFILAYRDRDGLNWIADGRVHGNKEAGWWHQELPDSYRRSEELEHAKEPRLETGGEGLLEHGCGDVANAERVELRDESGGGDGAHREGEAVAGDDGAHEWPPGPADAAGWAAYLARHPGTEPAVRGATDGAAGGVDISRASRLRMLGNGIVPQQAAEAIRQLARRGGR